MKRYTILSIGLCLASVSALGCGLLNTLSSGTNSSHKQVDAAVPSTASTDKGSISLSLADPSFAEVKKITLTLDATDGSTADNRSITEDFVSDKAITVADLVIKSYKIVLQLLDKDGNSVAQGEASDVAIKAGIATVLKVTVTKIGVTGGLKIEPVAAKENNGTIDPVDPGQDALVCGADTECEIFDKTKTTSVEICQSACTGWANASADWIAGTLKSLQPARDKLCAGITPCAQPSAKPYAAKCVEHVCKKVLAIDLSQLSGNDAKCTGAGPGPDYVCMQGCGGPVVRAGDPAPGFYWTDPDGVYDRQHYGCPICLPPSTRIATPSGEVFIRNLRRGSLVFSLDEHGKTITSALITASSTPVPKSHKVVHLVLTDGRMVEGSFGHPTADGRLLGNLRAGDQLDGAKVQSTALVPYYEGRTYDILPSGPTGAYVAQGVALGSTLKEVLSLR